MNRRVIAAFVAALLALIGAGLLYSYVASANARAMAGMETAKVLVVAKPITKGTPATILGNSIEVRTLPKAAIAPGAASDLSQLSGLVAAVDLLPGEQVLTARFVDPVSLKATEVEVPKGMQEVTILVSSERVRGGQIKPGETVGVTVSLVVESVPFTHMILHKVLVTRVQGGVTAPTATASPSARVSAPAAQDAPQVSVMVTLAVTAADAEKVIFGAEHGKIYLTVQPSQATETGTTVVNPTNIYK